MFSGNKNMNNRVIEVVTFKLNKGVSEEDFLKTVTASSEFISTLDGLISRRLSCDSEGNWLEHVEWESLAHAEAASVEFGKAEEVKPFIKMIDTQSLKMSHNRLLASVQ